MKYLRSALALLIVFVLGCSVSTFGKVTHKDITVELRDIEINVNDKKVKMKLEPFIYEDTQWIPITFVSKSLDKYVEWDSETNTINIWDEKPEEDKNEITVYVTKTGKKYHREGCSYLKKSKIAKTLKDAKAEGYTPCSRCNPPR